MNLLLAITELLTLIYLIYVVISLNKIHKRNQELIDDHERRIKQIERTRR